MATAPTALEVVVSAEEVDLVSGLLWGAGVSAVAEHPEPDGRVRLRADLPAGGIAAVRAVLGDRWVVEPVVIVDDGLDAWREHARAVRVGRLVVRPPWVDPPDADAATIEVVIDPGRAFGHGAHPTTRLCLAALERLLVTRPGASVLDVGCGSGVLSVAAARLGAARVVGVDVDPEAVRVTGESAAGNGVGDRVEVLTSGADPTRPLTGVGGPFEVVVANIGAATLEALAPAIVAAVADGGVLVVSGTLDPPPATVASAFAPLVVRAVERLEGWSALELSAPPA